jgi:hypothetical protein
MLPRTVRGKASHRHLFIRLRTKFIDLIINSQDAKNRPEKRTASQGTPEPGFLPIYSSPDLKRLRKASDRKELETILDFLDLLYQPLRDLSGIQSQPGPSINGITQSASNS